MGTIIDELTLVLGIDSRQFATQAAKTQTDIEKTGRAAVSAGKALEDTLGKTQSATDKRLRQGVEVGKQSAAQFAKLRTEIVALFSALGLFGLEQFIRNIALADTNTGRLATRLGMSTKELGTWQEASKRTGGSAEATGAAFVSLSQDYQNWRITGQSEMLPWLQTMGVAWETAEGKMRPIGDIMLDISKKFQGMSSAQANAIGAHFAMDPGLVALLQKGPAGVQALLAEMAKLGVANDEQAAAAARFENSLQGIEQRARDLGRTIFNDLAPAIDEAITGMAAWYDKNKDWLKSTIDADVKLFVDNVKAAWPEINKVVTALGGWKDVTEAILGLWVLNKFAPMMLVVTNLLRLLAILPGSGVTAAALSSVGILALPLALSGDTVNGGPATDDGSVAFAGLSAEERARRIEAYNVAHPGSQIESFSGMLDRMWRGTTNYFGGGGTDAVEGATDERKAAVRDKIAAGLGISGASASGIVSNLNAESGIAGINERNPTIPGSRGGFGWAQWTGERRVAFESYARLHGQDPASDDANYGFLIHELSNNPAYAAVLAKLRSGGISAYDAANVVARGYIVPPDATLPGHVAGAEGIARLPPAAAGVPHAAFDPSLLRGGSSPGARVAAAINDNSRGPVDNSSDVTIHTMNIATQATDANGISRAIADRLKRSMVATQADRGLA